MSSKLVRIRTKCRLSRLSQLLITQKNLLLELYTEIERDLKYPHEKRINEIKIKRLKNSHLNVLKTNSLILRSNMKRVCLSLTDPGHLVLEDKQKYKSYSKQVQKLKLRRFCFKWKQDFPGLFHQKNRLIQIKYRMMVMSQ